MKFLYGYGIEYDNLLYLSLLTFLLFDTHLNLNMFSFAKDYLFFKHTVLILPQPHDIETR